MAEPRELAPGEWAVLALLSERPAHGWALANQLGPDGELGAVWSIGRPLVYRSLEILVARGLAEEAGMEPGSRGPNRTIFKLTPAGRAAVNTWLEAPVEHVRDSRSQLLLKLVVADRAGIDPEPMLIAQHDAISASLARLEERLAAQGGSEEILLRFRIESTRAVLRFVEGSLAEHTPIVEAV